MPRPLPIKHRNRYAKHPTQVSIRYEESELETIREAIEEHNKHNPPVTVAGFIRWSTLKIARDYAEQRHRRRADADPDLIDGDDEEDGDFEE